MRYFLIRLEKRRSTAALGSSGSLRYGINPSGLEAKLATSQFEVEDFAKQIRNPAEVVAFLAAPIFSPLA
jgi:hypothetical protein